MLRLAWRNLWRNGRRSLLTLSSIACGLAAIMFGQSMIKTIQRQLIENTTSIITGHLQIQQKDVREFKYPEKSFGDLAGIERVLSSRPDIQSFEKRILVTGLVSGPRDSNGVLICGVEPQRDPRVTRMHEYLRRGTWLTGRPGEVTLGDVLADALGVKLGDSLVLLSQASDGSMGADRYRVVGIYHSGSQTFDKQIVYVPLASLQETLSMEGRVNNVVMRLRDPERMDQVRGALASALDGRPLKVLTWRDVDEELVGVQAYQNALLKIVLFIIFAIVALGVLNTVFMSLFERIREFGILKAMGARPRFVMRLVLAESAMLGALGGAAGLAIGSAFVRYYGVQGLPLPLNDALSFFLPFDPILYLRFDWPTHREALVAVMATSVVAALPPALHAARLKPVECLRHR